MPFIFIKSSQRELVHVGEALTSFVVSLRTCGDIIAQNGK